MGEEAEDDEENAAHGKDVKQDSFKVIYKTTK
jgi:hypothetical protein